MRSSLICTHNLLFTSLNQGVETIVAASMCRIFKKSIKSFQLKILIQGHLEELGVDKRKI